MSKTLRVHDVRIVPYARRLQTPVRSAQGVMVQRQGFWLRLTSQDGVVGVGEACAWPGFGSTHEELEASLNRVASCVADRTLTDLRDIDALLLQAALPAPWRYAVELALLDALAQQRGVPVRQLLRAGARAQVPVHVLVPDAVSAQLAVRAGARALKVKVGAELLETDVIRVGAIRAAAGDAINLRLDANGAWSEATARRAMRLLAAFRPQWIEQPVPADDVAALGRLRREGIMPVAADEALVHHGAAVMAEGAADVWVLKPMFLGGLLACRKLHEKARRMGVRTVVTHALESAVGRMGAAHLAAALDGTDATAGIGGALEHDVAEAARVVASVCELPSIPGLGLTWAPGAQALHGQVAC